MRKPIVMLMATSVWFSLLCLRIHAQQPSGSISGLVEDSSGAIIPQARITIKRESTGEIRELVVNATGHFLLPGLVPDVYQVKVEAGGFNTLQQGCLVEVGRVTSLKFQMAVGSLNQVVEVAAESVQVNTVQSSLEGIVTGQSIRSLPLNGRNFLDLGQLEPGVQLQDGANLDAAKSDITILSVGGQSGRSTRITVDGLDISDEGSGTVTLNLSPDAIQEYQLSRSSLDISTGLTGTGAVNIVTRSGGNDLHGEAYFFGRTNQWAARVGQENFPFDREQVGFNLGGPFRRNRLFWFLSYEQNNQDGASATQIAGFPTYSRTWRIPFDEKMALARLDWNPTSNLRVFSRFFYNFHNGLSSGSLGGNMLIPYSNYGNSNHSAVGLDYTRGNFTHSLRFGFLNFNDFIKDAGHLISGFPATIDPEGNPILFHFLSSGPFVGPSPWALQKGFQNNLEWRYDGTISFSRHSLHFGALLNLIQGGGFFSYNYEAPHMFVLPPSSETRALCGEDILCYPVGIGVLANGLGYGSEFPALGEPFGGVKNNRFHWYFADSWRINPRWNLQLGVRYVYEPGSVFSGLNKSPLLEEIQPGLSQPNRKDKNNFAPHIGVAWDITGQGKWVARIGAGIYYDSYLFFNLSYERGNYLPRGISYEETWVPYVPVISPVDGSVIFDMTGNSPDAKITPGVNWVNGCSDPRFPDGSCPMGTPGLLTAISGAWRQYGSASRAATALFPQGPSSFEQTLYIKSGVAPNFQTPYTFQFNAGIQRELRKELVLSVDYLRHRGLHYPTQRDFNRLGAADTLRVDAARAAMGALHGSLGCPPGPEGVDCAIAAGASIQSYASYNLGGGVSGATPGNPSPLAFPGNNPKFNYIAFQEMQGWSTYNALQVNLRGTMPDLGSWVRDWKIVTSYSLGRLFGPLLDQTSGLNFAADNDHPLSFYGPTSLDRTHILSVGSTFRIPGKFQLSSIWRVMSPLSQSVAVPYAPSLGSLVDQIFYTDFNGDGTTADPLPGTNRGSFGRSVKNAKDLNRLIDQYNLTQAGQLTPAGKSLVKAALFTEAQLKALGAVSPTVQRAPEDQVGLDSFITTDVRLSRPFKLKKEAITIEPAIEWFNVFNIGNYDLPGNILNQTLDGQPGSINGTTAAFRPNRAGFGSGSFALGIPRSWQFGLRVSW